MFWLSVRAPHCVSCTEIGGRVRGCQTVHFQIHRARGFGDGESTIHPARVLCATTTTNISDLFQLLPWSLADPAHVVATERESRDCAGECQTSSML